MTSKHDDQLLQQLYRQQVQQTKVPNRLKANLLAQNQQQNKSRYWQKAIAILPFSSGISFSIFALISHFYQPKTVNKPVNIVTKRTIPVELTEQPNNTETLVITVEPLPELPNVALPPKPTAASPTANIPLVAKTPNITDVKLSANTANSTQIKITQPQLLTHKVMPIYPKKALIDGLSATVVLNYVVNNKGDVEQIQVLSDSPRILNKAAITALAQWQFSPQAYAVNKPAQKQQVEFIFKLPE